MTQKIEGKRERAHKGGAENVGLQTKSSLGLDFRTTGWFIYGETVPILTRRTMVSREQ